MTLEKYPTSITIRITLLYLLLIRRIAEIDDIQTQSRQVDLSTAGSPKAVLG